MTNCVITDPTDSLQLNLDYIISCLNRAGSLEREARLTDYRLERLGADNSMVYRIHLVYEGTVGDSPESLFLKLCTGGAFGRSEVDYYTKDYLGLCGVPIPTCYDACYEHSSYHLLLEDLTNTHRNNWGITPTLAYGKTAARALAKLHSYYWGTDRLQSAGYDAVDQSQLARYLEHMSVGLRPLLEELQDDSGTAPQRDIVSDVFKRHPDAMARRLSSGGPLTLIHGDVNPGNILSQKDDSSKGIYLIDRQPFKWSLQNWVGPSDLSYMMVLWWDPEYRRMLEHDVLSAYYNSLIEFGVKDYTWEMALSDYRLSALQCFYIAASWCINPEERTNMRWLWSSQLERACAFYQDWQCHEVL